MVRGRLEIDLFTDEATLIPLSLGGGVLAQADWDGKPARLSVIQAMPDSASPQPGPQPGPQQPGQPGQPVQVPAPNPPAAPPAIGVLGLGVSGKGRHTLDISMRIKLDRRGGWRGGRGFAAPCRRHDARPERAPTANRGPAGQRRRSADVSDRKAVANHRDRPARRRRAQPPVASASDRGPGRPHAQRRVDGHARRAGGRPAGGVAAGPRVPPQPARPLLARRAGRLPAGAGRGQQRPRLGSPQARQEPDWSTSRC